MKRTTVTFLAVILIITFSSCATNVHMKKGITAEEKGEWDKAVLYFTEAVSKDKGDIDSRLRLESARRMASNMHLNRARDLWEQKLYDDALLEYRTARELNPLNRAALMEFNQKVKEMEALVEAKARKEALKNAKTDEQAAEEALAKERPMISVNSKKTQSFYFPNRELGEIYQSLSKLSGLNIVYHNSVRSKLKTKTDFIVNRATFWDAFDHFITANNHFYRVINKDTVMIIDGSSANRKNFEDKIVKVFYLSNADVRDVFSAVRMVAPDGIKISNIRAHNAIIVRDTPQKVAILSKLIEVLDKPKAEVIIDIEFLEVGTNVMNDVGALLSAYSVTQSFSNPDITPGDGINTSAVRLDNLDVFNKSNMFMTIPSVAYNFLKTSSNAKLLAKPQLRITDMEKSELHIGARVPVRKSTFNPGSAAGIGSPVDSYEYENTGIKFTMTPRVHHNGEISIEMDIEISAIGAGADSTNPTFTTRNIKSKLRLADGETNLLAGLIREEEKFDTSGVAGLSDIPILGRLFSKNKEDRNKTDIIITITPHIVRGGKLSLEDLKAIKYGPQINPGYNGLMTMEELMNMRFLRGIPLSTKDAGSSSTASEGEEDEYYYEEDEYVEEDEEEEQSDEEGR